MAVRAHVSHRWAVTRGNHPNNRPYYCPLPEQRYGAATALYDRLLQPVPDAANSFWIALADQAVVIPREDAVFWYAYAAVVESTWLPVDETTDQDTILAAARSELTPRPRPTIIGDHPNHEDAPQPTTPRDMSVRSLWLVTLAGQDPNSEEEIWYSPVFDSDIDTYAQARHAYLSMARQLNESAAWPPEPTEGISFWHSLQATADSPWYPADQHADPTSLTDALYDALTTP